MFDVAVVGAGPAGSVASHNLAKQGFKVLLLDRKSELGVPKQCAEGLSKRAFELAPLSVKDWKRIIEREVTTVGLHNKLFLKISKGITISRKRFDKTLALKALDAGAVLKNPVLVKGFEFKKEFLVLKTSKGLFKSKVLIGADGFDSLTAKTLALKHGFQTFKPVIALQVEVKPLSNAWLNVLNASTFHTFTGLNICNGKGYAWIFPKRETINIGIGCVSKTVTRTCLQRFLKLCSETFNAKVKDLKVLEFNAGGIPVKPLKRFAFENALLIGDAAGHANPLTGGGVIPALIDANMAASVVEKHLTQGTSLTMFENLWRSSDLGFITMLGEKASKPFFNLASKGFLDRAVQALQRSGFDVKKFLFSKKSVFLSRGVKVFFNAKPCFSDFASFSKLLFLAVKHRERFLKNYDLTF
ncbi:NAD(P)/FAD-dependent oxidoreductase [Candidatus Woesearchaeota archaeon]|nr:NAD(P)/FAD-dependent oxidoreductase [Candidatus Woesearchaeota archaeon]